MDGASSSLHTRPAPSPHSKNAILFCSPFFGLFFRGSRLLAVLPPIRARPNVSGPGPYPDSARRPVPPGFLSGFACRSAWAVDRTADIYPPRDWLDGRSPRLERLHPQIGLTPPDRLTGTRYPGWVDKAGCGVRRHQPWARKAGLEQSCRPNTAEVLLHRRALWSAAADVSPASNAWSAAYAARTARASPAVLRSHGVGVGVGVRDMSGLRLFSLRATVRVAPQVEADESAEALPSLEH